MRGQGKAKIVIAAHAALLDHGRAGIRIDDIARAASINKRMIYHYFDDREGLVQGVLAQALMLVQKDVATSAEMKGFLGDLFAHLTEMEDEILLNDVQSALRVLLIEAQNLEPKYESKYLLSRQERRVLAQEIASVLYPEYFESPKPVYRLQSDFRASG